MTVREILKMGDPRLLRVAQPVTEFDTPAPLAPWLDDAGFDASGLTLAVGAGIVLGRMRLERWVEPFVYEIKVGGVALDPSQGLSWAERFAAGAPPDQYGPDIEKARAFLRQVKP